MGKKTTNPVEKREKQQQHKSVTADRIFYLRWLLVIYVFDRFLLSPCRCPIHVFSEPDSIAQYLH